MSSSKDIECQNCNFTCENPLELNIHSLRRHRKCSIQPNCQATGSSHASINEEIEDIFQHAKSFHQWEVYCKLCTFKSLQKLIPHIVLKHLACFKCYKTFENLKSLKDHLDEDHTGPKDLLEKCKKCQFTSFSWKIQEHFENVHLKGKLHKCEKCDQVFKQRHMLVRHTRTQSTFETCDICPFKSCTLEGLRKHERRFCMNDNEMMKILLHTKAEDSQVETIELNPTLDLSELQNPAPPAKRRKIHEEKQLS